MSNVSAEALNDQHLRLWGIPLMVIATLFGLMPFFFPGRWDLFRWYLLAGLIYTSLTWEVCRWALIRIRKRLPGLENTRGRIVRTTVVFTLVAGTGQLILNAIFYRWGLAPPALINSSFLKLWLINFSAALFFVTLNNSIYEAIYFFSQYKGAIQKTEQLKKQQIQQQLDALKSRVNPHFLFNSLTTLSALIGENAQRAEQFVDELSKVYRYLLRAGRQATATLHEELQFAESYSFLLKNRFEEGAFSLSTNNSTTPPKNYPPKNYFPENYPQENYLKENYPQENYPQQLPAANIPILTLQNALDYLVRTQNTPLHIQVDTLKNQLRISCKDHRKSRAFDALSTDWQQLESNGAVQNMRAGRLEILIPITVHPDLP